MRRSLIHFWRVHIGLVLGTTVATTALTGALLVGDSVRGSLRDLALERLGRIDHALVSERFFRASLSADLPWQNAPAILFSGSARNARTQARASRVQIQGIDARFSDLFPTGGSALRTGLEREEGQAFPSLVVSASLQRELGISIGDAVLLSLERRAQAHRESLFGRRDTDDIVTTLRVMLKAVLPDSGPGRFGLRPHQHLPFNAYVDLATLQRALGQTDQINALLVAAPDAPVTDLQAALKPHLNLADLGLDLELHEDFISLESTRFVLESQTIEIAVQSATQAQLATMRLLTYLANEIAGNGHAVPYSTVTALDDPAGLFFIDGSPAPELADGEIYLDAWTAHELQAAAGDSLTLSYYVVGPREELSTTEARFALKGIVAMRGLAIDRALTPEYPGLQGEVDISAWDAPFPVDMGAIRPVDEAYWDDFGAAPKAFVSAATGQRLWRSRFGELTALRFYAPAGTNLSANYQKLSAELRRRLRPEQAGLAFRPVRQTALDASAGATDFSGLFFGFSLFLIVAAALLVVLLCKFGLEQRAREAGLLLATGYPLAAVRRRFVGEGVALASIGALLGLGGAQLYAYLLLVGLRTWWLDAVGTPFLHLHSTYLSLGVGYFASLLLVSLTLWRTVHRFHQLPVRALLAGDIASGEERTHTRARLFAGVGLVLALVLSGLANSAEATTAAALFFGSGTCALLALLALFSTWLRTAKRRMPTSSLGMGIGNSARSPSRSALCTGLIACATFVIVAVGANRRVEWRDDPGTGGFSLVAEAEIPLHRDLNDEMGRFELGLTGDLGDARFFPMRVLPGEDISCLNLYQPQTPRLLGAPPDFLRRGGFAFQQTEDLTPEEDANPWLLLERDLGPGVVPAIGDFNSTQWILHRSLGEDVIIEDESGGELKLRLVGLLQGSLFQGELLIAESRLVEYFPGRSGYGYFLVETQRAESVAATLEKDLAAYGLDAVSSAERLRAYHAVENTYLSTFQTLGGLGLLLGTFGLGILLLRSVLERSGELATLSACGYRRARLGALLLCENGFLLLVGLGIGSAAALVAVAPRLLATSPFPWTWLATSLGLVLFVGLLASFAAVRLALRRPLLAALKAE